MDFKIKVRLELMKRDLTMTWLANELGITLAYLSDILNGNRKAHHYRKKIIRILELDDDKHEIK